VSPFSTLLAAILASGPAPAPGLTVTVSVASPAQGGLSLVTVTSERPLAALAMVDGETRTALERDASGTTFRGLLGVDLAAAPGAHPLVFETPDGSARLVWPMETSARKFRVQRLSVDPRYVEVPKEELDRVKADQVRVAEAYSRGSAVRLFTSFARPLKARSNGNFGVRRVYNGKTESIHAGLDLAAAEGTSVKAAGDGRVVLAGDLYFSGGTVLLDHGAGLFTQYFHLSRIDVKEGDDVTQGTRLGASGRTGRVTGPHLHWGAKLRGARVNPEDLLALPAWPLPPRTPPAEIDSPP
jgi:murein DD-endopeptidase MepM/ murein hydrolase activator NlpD